MAKKQQPPPPAPAIEFNPTTLAVLAATLLVGILVGYVVGSGTETEETDTKTTRTASTDKGTMPTAKSFGPKLTTRVLNTCDSGIPSLAAASSPKDSAAGSWAYSCTL